MALAGGSTNYADYAALAAASLSRPLVRLVAQSAQSIPNSADTAITFGAGSEDIDTHGFHDTSVNISRITPSVAGYYQLSGNVWYVSDADVISYYAMIAKNGSPASRSRVVLPSTATTGSRSINAFAVLPANGTTDYFELLTNQTQAAVAALSTSATGTFTSVLECVFLRPL